MIGINAVGKKGERLANQMFQYAAVKGIAKTEVILMLYHHQSLQVMQINGKSINCSCHLG